MLLGHRVVEGNEMLVLHTFNGDRVVILCFFSLQSRQGNAAATDHRVSHAVEHIAADGTDIELAAQQIGGNVFIADVLPIHQLNDGNAQRLCQRLQQANIRQTLGSFPFGDRFGADTPFFDSN